MSEIVPTILAGNPDEYKKILEKVSPLANRIHVDICDGQFADNTTIGLAQVYRDGGIILDLHLMVTNPAAQLETAMSLKPDLIIFHAESEGDIGALMSQVRPVGIKAGIALLPGTKPQSVRELIELADHVLIFTGMLGHYGGEFNPEHLDKVEQIKSINPKPEISVDGGVNGKNAALVSIRGVDVLYVGSAIQGAEDPMAAFKDLEYQIGGSL